MIFWQEHAPIENSLLLMRSSYQDEQLLLSHSHRPFGASLSKIDCLFMNGHDLERWYGDGPRGDFTRGVAPNEIMRWQFGGKALFSREGWLKRPPEARICERGRSKCLPGPGFATGVARKAKKGVFFERGGKNRLLRPPRRNANVKPKAHKREKTRFQSNCRCKTGVETAPGPKGSF